MCTCGLPSSGERRESPVAPSLGESQEVVVRTESNTGSSLFCGVYGVIESVANLGQGATPPRDSIEDVLGDLVRLRQEGHVLHLVQIIDLQTLRPVEPWMRTMERLTALAADRTRPATARAATARVR